MTESRALGEPDELVLALDEPRGLERLDPGVAALLQHELTSRGIRTLIRPYEDTAYDGLFIPQKGWGALFVPSREADRAREIVDAARSARTESASEPTAD